MLDKNLFFHIYHKPTDSFNCLTYRSCHLPLTKNDILLPLAKRIVDVVINEKTPVEGVEEHLLDRQYPGHIIGNSFTKIKMKLKLKSENTDNITFIRTYNPNCNPNLKKLKTQARPHYFGTLKCFSTGPSESLQLDLI